jgi:hypothetical protein
MLENYLTKTNAIAYISMQTGYGRPIIERTMKQLQDAGRIQLLSPSFARAILISKDDVEIVISVLKSQQGK